MASTVEHDADSSVQPIEPASDAVDEEFRSTPLGLAARWGHRKMVAFLLERGADPNKAGCGWLGSQAEIEMYFDASQIIRTDVTVTCPVVNSRMVDLIPVGLK